MYQYYMHTMSDMWPTLWGELEEGSYVTKARWYKINTNVNKSMLYLCCHYVIFKYQLCVHYGVEFVHEGGVLMVKGVIMHEPKASA